MNIPRNPLYLLALLLFPILYGCKGNSIRIDTVKKIVTDEDGDGLVNFSISGEKEFVQYTLRPNTGKIPVGIYLLKPNPDYFIDILFKQDIEDRDNFVFKPIAGEKYTLKNSSNGDTPGARCEVIFDSLNNVTVIYPDTSRAHTGSQFK
jgi:hypothetical protein